MMSFNDLLKSNSLKNIGKFFRHFWDKYRKACFIFFSLAVMLFGFYLWYKYLYQSDWSNEEKSQYISSKNKEVEFKDQEFKKVLQGIEVRRAAYEKPSELAKDIFKPYEGEEKPEEQTVSPSVPAQSPASKSSNSATKGTF